MTYEKAKEGAKKLHSEISENGDVNKLRIKRYMKGRYFRVIWVVEDDLATEMAVNYYAGNELKDVTHLRCHVEYLDNPVNGAGLKITTEFNFCWDKPLD